MNEELRHSIAFMRFVVAELQGYPDMPGDDRDQVVAILNERIAEMEQRLKGGEHG